MNKKARIAGVAQGSGFLSVAGTAWLLWGLVAAFPSNYLLSVGAAAIGLSLFVVSRRLLNANKGAQLTLSESEVAERLRRGFKRINIAQWGAITLVSALLVFLEKQELIVPAIIAIVGIHFVPLSLLYRQRPHMITGMALVGVACLSALLAKNAQSSAWAAVGAGVVLLSSAAYALAGVLIAGRGSALQEVVRENG